MMLTRASPNNVEVHIGTEFPQLAEHRLVDEVVASDDGNGYARVPPMPAQPAQEHQAVRLWHSKIEEHRVEVRLVQLSKRRLNVPRDRHLIASGAQHPEE